MISRIYVTSKGKDTRGTLFAKSWKELGLSGKISNVRILNSYLIQSKLKNSQIKEVADALTDPILETFSINNLPKDLLLEGFNYLIEIGYLPGVTDNVGHTAKETISDLLHIKDSAHLEVYSSKVFLVSGTIKEIDIKKITSSLHNPLIERSYVANFRQVQAKGLPKNAPKVILKKSTPVMNVPLEVSNDKLIKIGKLGIVENNGTCRGPLALDLPSMQAIKDYFKKLKRNPTDIELESLAQTWSEHCKHTIFASPIDDMKDGLYKTYIKGATKKIRKEKGSKDFCVSVFSDNAGGIVFDKDFLITHKVETHNSPSVLDPFGGAITGIGGVNRDIIGFGLGSKPIANTYGFCFGYPDDKKKFFKDKKLSHQMLPPKRIMTGVIKGINVGGNTSGIPTLSGFIKFDNRYRAKPMVFAGTIGLIPRSLPGSNKNKKLSHEKKAKNGDYIVMVGGRVGLDGIHGATFSSVATDSNSPATAVQIGDPITQKKLSDAIVKEARDMNLYNSITDNGAGGFSSSVAEMAKECGGLNVTLDKVPLKYPGLRPWEIWISESQERMTLSVPKGKWQAFHKLMESRGVEATIIGEFINSGKCVVKWKGKTIMNMSMEFLHDGQPAYQLETSPTVYVHTEPKIPQSSSRTKILEELVGTLNLGGFAFISEQYDHEVQASSVLKPISGPGRINTDAQVFRPVLNSDKGAVLSYGIYPSYSDISTYHMAACALDTAVRNSIASGGTLSHLAILDNFCWCSSYDKKRLGELVEAVKACYQYAVGYGTPFISGKDSMFNDFNGYDEKGKPVAISIPPTLLISAVSVIPSIYKTVSPEFKKAGDIIYLLGETHNELGASEYFKLLAKKQKKPKAIGNDVPMVDLVKNLKTYIVLEKVIKKELLASSVSLHSGGLGIALAKACIGGMLGCNVLIKNLPGTIYGGVASVDARLFSESQGRVLVSVSPKNTKEFEKTVKKIPYTKLGKVEKNGKIVITDNKNKVVETSVKKLHTIYHRFSNKMS